MSSGGDLDVLHERCPQLLRSPTLVRHVTPDTACVDMQMVVVQYAGFMPEVDGARQVHTAVQLSRHLRGGVVELDDAALERGAFQELNVHPLSVLIHRHPGWARGAGENAEQASEQRRSTLRETHCLGTRLLPALRSSD